MSDTEKSWPSLKASLIITTTGGNCPTQLRQTVRAADLWRIELRAQWKSVGSLSRVSSAARYSGMLLRRILPEHHLTADSKDVVKLGMRPDCDLVRPRPRPADRVGKGFLRYAENRGLSDVQ